MKHQNHVKGALYLAFVIVIGVGLAVERAKERWAGITDWPWFWPTATVIAVLAVVFLAGITWQYFSNRGGSMRGRM